MIGNSILERYNGLFMNRFVSVILALFVSAMLIEVGRVSAAAPVVSRPAASVPAQAAWQQEWDKTVAAARQEGKLVIYTAEFDKVKQLLARNMWEKFGIKIDYVAQTGTELAAKVFAERRAGLYIPDLYLGGATTLITVLKPAGALAPLKPLLLLPEVVDEKSYFGNKLPFIDNEQKFIVCYGPAVAQTVAINTDLVKPGEIKNYDDLLKPKWKEKIVMYDPTIPGTANEWFLVIGINKGMDYHRQFLKQKPMVIRNHRLLLEWLARGKYPIALAPSKYLFADFKTSGAHIDWLPTVEGTYLSTTGSLVYYDKAPHPNAAKVFVNWLLSKEGSTKWSETTLMQTARKDVPTDFLDPSNRRDPNVKYLETNEELQYKKADSTKLAKEIYGPLLK